MKPAFVDDLSDIAKATAIAIVALTSIYSATVAAQEPAPRTLLALVSDRSTGGMVAAAHRYAQASKNSAQAVRIRSVSQINLLSDKALQELISQADGIVMAAIFGEPVERLLSLNYPAKQTRLAIDGDRRLLALHSDPQQGQFDSLSTEQKSALFSR